MRTRLSVMVAALLLASASAGAQQDQSLTGNAPQQPGAAAGAPEAAGNGEIQLGLRGTSFGSDADRARFQRYEDLRDGGRLDRFRYRRATDSWLFNAGADHVGYRDQRYFAGFNQYGRVKASVEWNQTPLYYSLDTSSIYGASDTGVLRIPNAAIRTGIQTGTLRLVDVNTFLGSPFDLRQRRDVAAFRVVTAVAKDVDATFTVTSTRKEGQMPWGASFGFSAANEVAAPIDHRTTDFGAALEWANSSGMARVGYEGSWFNNAIETMTYDSPFRFTDSTNPTAYVSGNGASQGRTAMSPDSTAHTFSAAGAYRLPARSRVTGALSIGEWNQNASLLPFTINTAIPPIPLDRPTAEAEALITSYTLNFTSRPVNRAWFNVRARRYDFDNRTPLFNVVNYVRFDQVIEPSILGHTEPFGYTRDFVDADASFSLFPYTAIKVGYGVEMDDRSFRLVEETTEHTLRTAIDTSGSQYVTVRLAYEHATRTGTGLDEEVFDEIGEQVSLRQFDISDRNRNRITALVQVTPIGALTLTASAQTGRDSRPDAAFGLSKLDTSGYAVGFDAAPLDPVIFGLTYGYEGASTNQNSRQANPGPQFSDPTRDWATAMNETVHYVAGSVDLIKGVPKTDIRFGLDWNRSNADYTYVLPANTTLAPVEQLPTLYSELTRASADVRYYITRRLAAGFVYMFDRYQVDDFQMGPNYAIGSRALPDGLMLGYFFRPYTANTAWARIIYMW